MAEKKLKQIGEEIKEKYPQANVAIVHRVGRLEISDVAVAIAVSTPHRDAAFKACRYAIERIKEMVPIWKKEHWEDGSYWVGDQQEMTPLSAWKTDDRRRLTVVKVQLFAGLAEAIGHRTLELPLNREITVEELKQYLAYQYPNHKDRIDKCMVAVNQEYADPDAPVSSQDEVVLIPPVSGG